jgi:hypothetical protein
VALKRFLVAALAALAAILPRAATAAEERPPQFIAISFDNCGELDRWQELSDFLASANAEGERIRFTFFVSGTNLLSYAKRGLYRGPGQAAGASNIGFGGSPEDVRRRIGFINRLQADGNEIASHAVGHFDGKQWSTADWSQEFRAYGVLFDDAGRNNGNDGLSFSREQVKGFRAPYLGVNAGLYAAQKEHRFRYDASGVGDADAWPELRDGIWRFKLANLRIAGSGKYTLSMDYNFLVAQSGTAGNPRMQDRFRDEMLQTYLAYFRMNYTGNRAPLHIGHHFSPMQGGAYQQALKTFANSVCGLPEVRCVTYRSLADYLDGLVPATLQAYQRGDFPRATAPALDVAAAGLRGRL